MTYTYGYLLEAVLAKMDLSSEEANELGLLNKIPFYANEGLSQITAGIKPRHKYATYNVRYYSEHVSDLQRKYHLDKADFISDPNIPNSALSPIYIKAREEYSCTQHVYIPCKMPSDFIRWSQSKAYYTDMRAKDTREATSADFNTYGDDEVLFLRPGLFRIPYDAYWFHFEPTTLSTEVIDIPMDIMECLPSYIAAQLFKIDDEQKSSILRNEFEIMIARIDDNTAQTSRSFHNGSDW